MMTRKVTRTLFASAFAVAAAAGAASAQGNDYGESLFMNNCAVCHGATGAGDGPVADFFAQRPGDLSVLAEDNDGVFPFSEVYQSIDGRREVGGHGTSEMPVWGDLFMTDALPKTVHPGVSADAIVQGRILALVYYIQSMQQ